MNLRRVVIESPLAAKTKEGVDANVAYARAAVRDSVLRGEAPIASHLLFTQPGILKDDVPDERVLGMKAGFAWTAVAEAVIVYQDRGISPGMKAGITRAEAAGIPVEYRSLPGEDDERFFSPAAICERLAAHGIRVAAGDLTLAIRTPVEMNTVIVWIASGAELASAPDCMRLFLPHTPKEDTTP